MYTHNYVCSCTLMHTLAAFGSFAQPRLRSLKLVIGGIHKAPMDYAAIYHKFKKKQLDIQILCSTNYESVFPVETH